MARSRTPARAAPVLAAVAILSAGGIALAQAGARTPDQPGSTSKAKQTSHRLDAAWKTGPGDVIGEEEFGVDLEGTDEAKLEGRPFGKGKALLDERFLLTYNHPGEIPRSDYSGEYHVIFEADVIRRGKFRGTFEGFYDYSVDPEGNPLAPPAGRITGGTRALRGARGSFRILDFHVTQPDPVKYAGRWKGSIRY